MAMATLSWTYVHSTELGFEAERKTGNLASPASYAVIGGTAANVFTLADTSVAQGTTYCYRVRAWNTRDGTPGGVKQYSAYSNVVEFTVPYGAPSAPTALIVS